MFKKLFTMIAIACLTTSTFAKSAEQQLKFSKDAPFSLWEINGEGSVFYAIADEPLTLIIYNKKLRTANPVSSDPILINCNNKPTIVKAGSSFACHIPAKGTFSVTYVTGFTKNGSEGVVMNLEKYS